MGAAVTCSSIQHMTRSLHIQHAVMRPPVDLQYMYTGGASGPHGSDENFTLSVGFPYCARGDDLGTVTAMGATMGLV